MPFYNIFSSKKELVADYTKILVDYREKNSLVPSLLISSKIPIEFTHLTIADYIIDDTAIERKTFSDLRSSIIDKRIFFQLKEITQYPKFILLIENKDNFVMDNIVRGFLLKAVLNQNIPLIFTTNEQDTAYYLGLISKNKNSTDFSLRPKKIALTQQEKIQFILEGFPSVGPVTAKRLMEKHHSLKNIINSSENDLLPILGKNTKNFISLISQEI